MNVVSPLVLAIVACAGSVAPAQVLWSAHHPTVVPPARFSSPLAYDSVRDRVVMFSGSTGGPSAAETWEYDGRSWARIVTSGGPSARVGHALVFDPISARVVLFGGSEIATGMAIDDTWIWDGATWVQRTGATPGPSPRFLMGACWFPPRGRVVTYGGQQGSYTFHEDMWSWDGTWWVAEPALTPRPGPRSQMGFGFDALRSRLVLVAGHSAAGTTPVYHDDTWEFDGAAWTRTSLHSFPNPRAGVSMAWAPNAGRMVLFGGRTASALFGDSWSYDGSAWRSEPVPTGLVGREYAGITTDTARGRAVMFGGGTRTALLADTWTFADPVVPTFVTHGSGCGGGSGVPVLSASTLPWQLEWFRCEVTVPVTAVAAAMLIGSTAAVPLDLGPLGAPGCRSYVDLLLPNGIVGLTVQAGVATLAIVPPASLSGGAVEFQGLVVDPTANALGLAFTTGATARIR